MLKHTILLTSIALILAVAWGCDDRGSGIEPVDLGDLENVAGVDPSFNHPFTPELTLQLKNKQELWLGSAIWPPTAVDARYPMPLLVLLAPEGGNRYYYFKAGLVSLYRELIASGEIQPMVVVCLGNDQVFGGYFYGNSVPAGNYDNIFRYEKGDALVPNDLIELLHWRYPATIEQAGKRGIGGIGQGAYGAFRAAIMNPGLFSSISVTDGPLDFDGSDDLHGMTTLFNDALAEQHTHYAANPRLDANEDPLPFDFNRDFDSSLTMPVSQMFIGGAFAFSPNDTLFDFERIVLGGGPTLQINITDRHQIADSVLPGGGDSTTFIGGIVRNDSQTRNIDFDFHLPFDATGTLYSPIWDRWMNNNLQDMHEAVGGSPLADINMWFGTNRHAKWEYHDMTQSWIAYCQAQGYAVEEYEYSSFTPDPITGDEYLFDILREMLIFHSNNFGD